MNSMFIPENTIVLIFLGISLLLLAFARYSGTKTFKTIYFIRHFLFFSFMLLSFSSLELDPVIISKVRSFYPVLYSVNEVYFSVFLILYACFFITGIFNISSIKWTVALLLFSELYIIYQYFSFSMFILLILFDGFLKLNLHSLSKIQTRFYYFVFSLIISPIILLDAGISFSNIFLSSIGFSYLIKYFFALTPLLFLFFKDKKNSNYLIQTVMISLFVFTVFYFEKRYQNLFNLLSYETLDLLIISFIYGFSLLRKEISDYFVFPGLLLYCLVADVGFSYYSMVLKFFVLIFLIKRFTFIRFNKEEEIILTQSLFFSLPLLAISYEPSIAIYSISFSVFFVCFSKNLKRVSYL